jgi:two-component system, OmpR family, sensor histidine kinase MprB
MSLRWRIAIALGGLAALAAAVACTAAYLTARDQLSDSLDRAMRAEALEIGAGPDGAITDDADGDAGGRVDLDAEADGCPPAALLPVAAAAQISDAGVVSVCLPGGPLLPAVAAPPAAGEVAFTSITVDGMPLRVSATPFHLGGVLQIARSEQADQEVLAALRTRLVLVTLLVAAGAAVVGWLIARRLVRPVLALRDAAQRIAVDEDLTRPVPVKSSGEIRDLATSFTSMVDALATSREQQRRLVADASHEMRTPLTSLTTNLDLLDRFDRLPPDDRPEVLAAVRADVDDLTLLMTELVDLASDRTRDEAVVDVELADLADAVATRARRRTGRTITVVTDLPAVVPGRPVMLERALGNLVDNADKYSPADTPIEIEVVGASMRVVDHGPGIDPSERALAFERFWRADGARSRPGSGLGLAIVHQIVIRHGGTVSIDDTPGGGASFVFDLPAS